MTYILRLQWEQPLHYSFPISLNFSREQDVEQQNILTTKHHPLFLSLQDRHVKKHGDGEPLVDSSQDYVLLLGYENQTHTVLRFKRKLDTCDVAYDVPITVRMGLVGGGWQHEAIAPE